MRRIPFVLATAVLLVACRAEAPVEERPAVSHEAMVAALAGNYIWDCTLRNEAGTDEWKFVLQKQKRRSIPETFLVEAGARFDQRVEVRREDAALVYTMKDTGKVLVASDGEVFPEGAQRTRASRFSTGRCTRGAA